MTTDYLYIDDEQSNAVAPYVDALHRAESGLRIAPTRPTAFADQLRELKAGQFDGLILDLRLDLVPDADGHSAEYRATTLAQEIRTRSAERAIKPFPIALWSTDVKLAASYERDHTSHDLFDLIHTKERVAADAAVVAAELVAVAGAYATARSVVEGGGDPAAHIRSLLRVPADQTLDRRVTERFEASGGTVPVHEYMRFLLREVMHTPGPLLDELRVAALLGVAISKSPDWPTVREEILSPHRYEGVFSAAWPRWWKAGIEQWWAETRSVATKNPPPSARPLRLLRAGERVERLTALTGLQELAPAAPIRPEYSDRFTTICEGLRSPLDPVDGFQIRGPEAEPWQERRYLSGYAALEHIGYDQGLRIHPMERERYEQLLAESDPTAVR